MIVPAEEGLRSGEDMPHHHGGAERVQDVFVVGVQQKSVVDIAYLTNIVPEKPMTALMSISFSI